MGKKIGRALILLLNITGLACLAYCGAMYLSHDINVANPNAMLPMESWDRGGLALTLGVVPLTAANALAYAFLGTEKSKWLRLCFFIPALVCLGITIHYWVYALR